MSLMLVTDVVECINYNVNKKIRRYSLTYFYGIIFCLSFFLYVIPELAGVFTKEAEQERMKHNKWNPNEILPELLFFILLMSFIKLL